MCGSTIELMLGMLEVHGSISNIKTMKTLSEIHALSSNWGCPGWEPEVNIKHEVFKVDTELGMVVHTCNLAIGKPKHEDCLEAGAALAT